MHNASTKAGSTGAPIIRRCKDNYIIGIHFGASIKNRINLAISFDSILDNIKGQYYNITPDKNNTKINILHNNNLDKNKIADDKYEKEKEKEKENKNKIIIKDDKNKDKSFEAKNDNNIKEKLKSKDSEEKDNNKSKSENKNENEK